MTELEKAREMFDKMFSYRARIPSYEERMLVKKQYEKAIEKERAYKNRWKKWAKEAFIVIKYFNKGIIEAMEGAKVDSLREHGTDKNS